MRQEETRSSEKPTYRGSLNALVERQSAGSWEIAPGQMHDLLTAYWTSCRRTTGAKLDLAIEIAEGLGPMPCDYAILMLQIIDECVRYIGSQINGTASVEVRLSEARRNAKLAYVANRGPVLPRPVCWVRGYCGCAVEQRNGTVS